jgi:hypothetical protein
LFVLPSVNVTVSPELEVLNDPTGISVVVTASVLLVPLPQPLTGVTVILPEADDAVTVILLVKLVPVQPDGKLQIYDVAPDTGVSEQVVVLPTQGCVVPQLIEPATDGTSLTVITELWEELFPQPLLAVTMIVPPVGPAVAFMLLVMLVPPHPDGSVQV